MGALPGDGLRSTSTASRSAVEAESEPVEGANRQPRALLRERAVRGGRLREGEALRGRISARVLEALEKYFDGGFSGHVTVGKEAFGFQTECVVHLDSGIMLRADSMAADAKAQGPQEVKDIRQEEASVLQGLAQARILLRRPHRPLPETIALRMRPLQADVLHAPADR